MKMKIPTKEAGIVLALTTFSLVLFYFIKDGFTRNNIVSYVWISNEYPIRSQSKGLSIFLLNYIVYSDLTNCLLY